MKAPKSRSRMRPALLALLATGLLLASTAPAAEAAAPSLRITTTALASHFTPGDATGTDYYLVRVANVGGAPTDGSPVTISDELPAGVSFHPGGTAAGLQFGLLVSGKAVFDDSLCQAGATVSCTTLDHAVSSGSPTSPGGVPPVIEPGGQRVISIPVNVDAGLAGTTVTNQVTVSGGGAPTASASEQTPVSAEPAPFGFQEAAFSLSDDSGNPASGAGSHPYDLNTRFLLNSVVANGGNSFPAASLRDVHVALPQGLVVNPQATTARCTEAQLETGVTPPIPNAGYINDTPACPDASAIGIARATDLALGALGDTANVPVYNMVAPPGMPAQFGFVIYAAPLFVHIRGGLSPADGYRLSGDVRQLEQFGGATGIDLDLWGDPSAPSHDNHRGACTDPGGSAPGAIQGAGYIVIGSCPVAPVETPFLTMPSACSGPLQADISADSYENPGDFISASPQSAGPVVGCSALAFAPSLKARPTTNTADSPSGLEVDLGVPQSNHVNTLATANLKKAVVTLPEGLVVNPSGANGLGACSSGEIGLSTAVGQTPVRFSGDHPSCPDASKIGTVEIDTPLLAEPLPGAVYIAAPHDNPFGTLLAIYIVVDDPATGVVIKLAGKVEPDPATGRLTTSFDDNPELPFSDFKLNFFGGADGTLRTPATCGSYSTTSALTPWSGTPAQSPHDDYAISQSPGGGSCPSAPGAMANAPSFDAGTANPIAGAYSPFVVNLRRADDSQQFSALSVTPPPGLVGKLAGTPACSAEALSAASNKTGQDELADPSCPAASKVGTVDVAAGAGPDPYNVQGIAYMAGPYKGAPLSLAIVTPALAGPFDLGTVVVRAALQVDPTTAQITALSDPLPAILQGIPLDIRSAAIELDKPDFTLNGTSCDPLAVSASLLSSLGQSATLSQHFQLGECTSLPYKPKFSLRFKGAIHRRAFPKLIATLSAKEGEANTAFAQVQLPKAAFLANAHIGLPCTRVLFAAGPGGGADCPPKPLVGRAEATTPLLDYPLAGNVYLRTNPAHELPDLVVAFQGPPSQPIQFELQGKTDSVKGALRNTFETAPDVPVSKFRLELFGGKKGLVELSEGLCANRHAVVALAAHDNASSYTTPLVRADCKGHKKHKRHRRQRAR